MENSEFVNSSQRYDPLIDTQPEDGEGKGFKHPDSVFKKHPYKHSNWISKIFFSWPSKLVRFGKTHRLKETNLGGIYPEISAEVQQQKFVQNWEKYKASKRLSIFKALMATYKRDFILATSINFIVLLMQVAVPFLINAIIEFMTESQYTDTNIWNGVLLVSAYVFISCSSDLVSQQGDFIETIMGSKSYSALTTLIYNKTLKVTPSTNKDFAQGEIINFIQVDAPRACGLCLSLPPIARLPFVLIFCLVFLFYTFGLYLLPAIGVALVLAVLNFFFAIWNANLEKQHLKRKDKRMNMTTEVVNNIKVIKLNSWTKYFLEKVTKQRNYELSIGRKSIYIISVEIFLFIIMTPTFMIGTFAFFFLFGNSLTLGQAFAATHVLRMLEEPIKWVPQFIGEFTQFLVSMKRVEKFLLCDEINQKLVEFSNPNLQENSIDILIENSSFSWAGQKIKEKDGDKDKEEGSQKEDIKGNPEETKLISNAINEESVTLDNEDDLEANTIDEISEKELEEKKCKEKKDNQKEPTLGESVQLKDINLQISKGEFVCIIGEVGSGKSSLLNAILGDMLYLSEETIRKNKGKILNCQLRKILHTEAMKEESKVKLGGTISYVQQMPWIQNKTIRDNILFGLPLVEERYNKTVEICQLGSDLEILSGGDLTEIGEKGINLSGGQKARVSLARAVYADRDIILMDDPISALDANVKRKVFDKVFTDELKDKTRVLVTHAIDFLDRADRIIIMENGMIKYNGPYEDIKHHEEVKHIVESLSHKTESSNPEESKEEITEGKGEIEEIEDTKNYIKKEGSRITDEENDEIIDVNWGVYIRFLTDNFTWLALLICIIIFIAYAFAEVQGSISFGNWIQKSRNKEDFWGYFWMVCLFPFLNALFLAIIFAIMVLTTLRSSKILHEGMLQRILLAPINLYFDKTPSGRILNRFSKDIDTTDYDLGDKLVWTLLILFECGATILIAAMNSPWVLIAVPFFLILLGVIMNYYMKTYRELKRLESVTHSPILNNLSETLSGLSTIRNFMKEEDFVEHNKKIIDTNINTEFWQAAVQRWLTVRLHFTGKIIMITAMALMLFFRKNLNPVLVSVFLVHVYSLCEMLLWGVIELTGFESQLVSYQRCLKVLEIPQERQCEGSSMSHYNWPSSGAIEFDNYSLKYRPETEIVLKNLKFSIKNKEKIGVIGRTGAGKSTICLALCRIVEAYGGTIKIDGSDISKIPLEELRKRITIIPQDPALFSGSIRFNLDPEGVYSDSELLDLTNQASLSKLIKRDEKGLDQEIEEGGKNLSSGEKQLLCICRAILKQNKVVLMDEATANIDIKTEETIQNLIHEKFEDSTVITIAHRLNTIMESDRILVLDKGQLAEFDSPRTLLENPDSIFRSYVDSFKSS
ncbi:unnamed protein product [Moneuplotes crassus]|uniref:Uncharacterized protein n=1 Tax=Euplotes crassus TaxID=5936 RepID=A0AAD1U3M5_EUPCR|nr:unnamed protein product [Moneuplotes crassus]